MKYRLLGRTGLLVSELCFGAMTFGGKGFWSVIGAQGDSEADELIGRALEAGVNFIDTADAYSEGESERMVGKVLSKRRKEVVIATKARLRSGKGPNDIGLSRGHILDAVHASLDRLGTDYIDLYQIHGPDPLTPIDETLRALDDLVRSGKVRYIGCSNLMAYEIMRALGVSERRGLSRFESLQAYYSIAGRDIEREVTPLLKEERVGLLVWGALAGGLLSGKYDKAEKAPEGARRARFDFPPVDKSRAFAIVDVMREVAAEHETTVPRVALAWLLQQPVVTSVIIGVKTREQLEDNLGAAELSLSAEDMQRLNEVSALPPEYPGWMRAEHLRDRS